MSQLSEAEYWKQVAVWLADCHAATAEYEGSLKRTSNSSRTRFRTICRHAVDMLSGYWPAGCYPSLDLGRVAERLAKQSKL